MLGFRSEQSNQALPRPSIRCIFPVLTSDPRRPRNGWPQRLGLGLGHADKSLDTRFIWAYCYRRGYEMSRFRFQGKRLTHRPGSLLFISPRLWDLAAGKTMVILTHHKKSIRALAIHPTEYSFASGSAGDGTFDSNFSGHNTVINTLSVISEGVFFLGGP